MARLLALGAQVSVWSVLAHPARAAEPVVSVWYRGSPAGVPRLDDLAAIRAVGFTGVTWPDRESAGIPELQRLAQIVGLVVVLPEDARRGSAETMVIPDARVDVPVAGPAADLLVARAWRAVARGARIVSFDPGQREGTGLTAADGKTPRWVAPAVAVARQLSANVALVGRLQPGPAVTIDPPVRPNLEVVLLDGGRSWVIVATNTSRERLKAVARLPAGVPYGLWVSWLDGTNMSMLSLPAGPRWTFDLDAGGAHVYIIDKKQRQEQRGGLKPAAYVAHVVSGQTSPQGFRLRVKLRRTAVALAEAGRRTAAALAEAVCPAEDLTSRTTPHAPRSIPPGPTVHVNRIREGAS